MIDRLCLKSSALASAVILILTGLASAHPHVFAEARMEVVVDEQDGVGEVRHVWRFDELFSSTIVLDFDTNTNLEMEQSELEEVGRTVRDSLADYNYFTTISHDGANIAITPPDRIHVSYENGQVLMFFSVKPEKPVPLAGKLQFGAYDPTMYVALDFRTDADLAIVGARAACERKVVRPDPDEILAQNEDTLTDAFYDDPGGNDLSKLFATRLELTC